MLLLTQIQMPLPTWVKNSKINFRNSNRILPRNNADTAFWLTFGWMLISSPKDTFQGNITFFCLPGQLSNTEGSATPKSSRRPFLCFQMGTWGYSVSFRGILGSSKFNCRVAVSREHIFSRFSLWSLHVCFRHGIKVIIEWFKNF